MDLYNGSGTKIVIESSETATDVDNLSVTIVRNTEAAIEALKSNLNKKFIKSFMLDCGRKYFSLSNIKLIIDKLSENGFNRFVLHFSDNEGFRFGLDDMTFTTTDGTTYDLSGILGANSTSQDGYLSQSDMDSIIEYANSKNIDVVGELDMPGHVNALLKTNRTFGQNYLDTSNKEAVKFAYAVLKKYADYFKSKGCSYFGIGADEVHNQTRENLIKFINGAVQIVASCGLIACMWNDELYDGNDYSCYHNTAVQVNYWLGGGHTSAKILEKYGFSLINSTATWYLVPNGVTTDSDYYTQRLNVLKSATPNAFQSGEATASGVQLCCWCDHNTSYGDDNGDGIVLLLDGWLKAFGDAMGAY